MTVLKPRSRTISVRLSEEEYAALTQLCSLTGARSVSDLTRGALHGLIESEHPHGTGSIPIDNFRVLISSLNQKIEQLAMDLNSLHSGGTQ